MTPGRVSCRKTASPHPGATQQTVQPRHQQGGARRPMAALAAREARGTHQRQSANPLGSFHRGTYRKLGGQRHRQHIHRGRTGVTTRMVDHRVQGIRHQARGVRTIAALAVPVTRQIERHHDAITAPSLEQRRHFGHRCGGIHAVQQHQGRQAPSLPGFIHRHGPCWCLNQARIDRQCRWQHREGHAVNASASSLTCTLAICHTSRGGSGFKR